MEELLKECRERVEKSKKAFLVSNDVEIGKQFIRDSFAEIVVLSGGDYETVRKRVCILWSGKSIQ